MQKTILAMAILMAFSGGVSAASFGTITIDGNEVNDYNKLNGGGGYC